MSLSVRGCRIGNTRSGYHQCHTWLTRYPGITIRHEAGTLFVPCLNMAHATVAETESSVVEAVAEIQRVDTGNSEYGIDAVTLEEPDRGFATIHR